MSERFHSLRFLTGRSQGSELAVPDPAAYVIGRSGDAGILLLDGMVSRRHARLSVKDGVVTLEDLGSANGTFVNGTKIRRATELRSGDRVLVGATILKLTTAVATAGTEPTVELAAVVGEPESKHPSGDLADGGLTRVLEAYANEGQDVLIDLRLEGGSAFVAIHRGRLWDCGYDGLPGAPPAKVLLRLLAVTRGEYEVRPGGAPEVRRLDLDVAALLVDSKRSMDELDVLRQRLPAPEASLVVPRPLTAPLVALDETELSLWQLSHNVGRIDRILDQSRLPDVDVVRRLLALMDRGYLRRG